MRYYGESNVPGAPGIQFAGGNFMGGEGSAINPEALKRDARQQKIYNKGINTDNPNEKEIFLRRTGPQLPLASNVFGAGNMAGMQLAQAVPIGDIPGQGFMPGPEPGFMPMPGFEQGPSPAEIKEQQEKMRRETILNQRNTERQGVVNQPVNYNRPQPFVVDVDGAGNAVEKISGAAVIQLDPNQKLKFGGTYMPGYQEENVAIPSAARLEAGYSTPSFGVNVNWRPQRQGAPIGGLGGQMQLNTRF